MPGRVALAGARPLARWGILATLAVGQLLHARPAPAQTPLRYSNRVSILAGLLQPLVLRGGNVEVNYFSRRLSFDYSHGFSLEPPTVGQFREQRLALHLPYSTGLGVGYRFSSYFDVRLEPKLHQWEVYRADQPATAANRLASFRTVTLGVGAYYRWFPFRRGSRLLQGVTTSTSVRWWQNVGSTQPDNQFSYANAQTGQQETLRVPSIGLANTPLLINVAVGYTFGGQ